MNSSVPYLFAVSIRRYPHSFRAQTTDECEYPPQCEVPNHSKNNCYPIESYKYKFGDKNQNPLVVSLKIIQMLKIGYFSKNKLLDKSLDSFDKYYFNSFETAFQLKIQLLFQI